MDIFYNKIKEICSKNEKVAMFIDIDGTIVEYPVYKDGELSTSTNDDHKILKQTQEDLGDRGYVFHLSSAII